MTTSTEEIKELKHEIKEQKKEIEHQKQEVKSTTKRLKKITNTLRLETKKQLILALMAGFGFLIALVWRDFLQEIANWLIINSHVGGPAILIKSYVAIITTIFAVIGIILITRWNKDADSSEKTEKTEKENK